MRAKEDREEGYYWVKWDLPSMGWSLAFWEPEKQYWYVINCEDGFSTHNFEFVSTDPIPNPYV
jgi:hypothetical protein